MIQSPVQQKHWFIVEDDHGRREYALDAPIYSIGRHPKCDIQIFSQFISRRHATLVQFPNEDGSFYYRLIDGNLRGNPSANGLRINGKKMPERELRHGDEIEFGANVRAIYCLLNHEGKASALPDEIATTMIRLKSVGIEPPVQPA